MSTRRRIIVIDEFDPEPTSLGLFVGCLVIYAPLDTFFPTLRATWVGWGLLAGVGLGALLHLAEGAADHRLGQHLRELALGVSCWASWSPGWTGTSTAICRRTPGCWGPGAARRPLPHCRRPSRRWRRDRMDKRSAQARRSRSNG